MPVGCPDLGAIREARQAIAGSAIRTPLVRLNAPEIQAEIYLKLENLQPIGSFKIRGAASAMAHMSADDLRKGAKTSRGRPSARRWCASMHRKSKPKSTSSSRTCNPSARSKSVARRVPWRTCPLTIFEKAPRHRGVGHPHAAGAPQCTGNPSRNLPQAREPATHRLVQNPWRGECHGAHVR